MTETALDVAAVAVVAVGVGASMGMITVGGTVVTTSAMTVGSAIAIGKILAKILQKLNDPCGFNWSGGDSLDVALAAGSAIPGEAGLSLAQKAMGSAGVKNGLKNLGRRTAENAANLGSYIVSDVSLAQLKSSATGDGNLSASEVGNIAVADAIWTGGGGLPALRNYLGNGTGAFAQAMQSLKAGEFNVFMKEGMTAGNIVGLLEIATKAFGKTMSKAGDPKCDCKKK